MKSTTVSEFQAVNAEAHAKALEIIAECGCPEDGEVVEEGAFCVVPHAEGFHRLIWDDYGPFNPVPTWIWDPDIQEWVMNDGDEYDRYCELASQHP